MIPIRVFSVAVFLYVTGFSSAQDDNNSFEPTLPPIAINDPCDPRHSVLDGISHRFRSDCGPRQWCKPTTTFDRDPLLALPTPSLGIFKRQQQNNTAVPALPSTSALYKPPSPFTTTFASATSPSSLSDSTVSGDFGVCIDKKCRRDEYPFGYKGVPFDQLPPQCEENRYCPDDERECQPLIPMGKMCQLNRDDSCEQSGNGSYRILCLQSLCRPAASKVGEACLLDSTAYLGYNESGHQVIATITRDDCRDGLYCEENTVRCREEKDIGSNCLDNRECLDFNCNIDLRVCQGAPQTLHQLPSWAWGLIVFSIIFGLLALAFALYKVHLRHRSNRSEEIDKFFSEQWTYRNSILSMHAAAAFASSSRNSRSSYQSQEKTFGKHDRSDSSEFDEQSTCNDNHKDEAWASSLYVKGSPTSSLQQQQPSPHPSLSPRLAHRRTPSP